MQDSENLPLQLIIVISALLLAMPLWKLYKKRNLPIRLLLFIEDEPKTLDQFCSHLGIQPVDFQPTLEAMATSFFPMLIFDDDDFSYTVKKFKIDPEDPKAEPKKIEVYGITIIGKRVIEPSYRRHPLTW